MTADEARAYLTSLSFHRNRPGDVANMNPDFAIRMATAIQQARKEGIQVSLLSGYREPGDHPSGYDLGGNSSHSYGLAGDVTGIGAMGSSTALRWDQIAKANGLSNPYGTGNSAEYNHYQLPKLPLEQTPELLAALQKAKASGDTQAMWSAFNPSAYSGPTAVAGAAMPDNRQIFFDALTKQAGLTPQQALGVLWGIGGESHPYIDTGAVNPKDPNGGAFGALQWVGSRRWPLEEIATHRGVSASDPHLQAEYMIGELTGNLQGAQLQPGVLAALKAAKTPEEATRIWVSMMERPKVNNSEDRIRQGGAVGSLGPNGEFIPGMAGKGNTPIGASAGATTAPAAPGPAQPAPEQTLGGILGQAFAGMGASAGGGGSGGGVTDPPDQPAIRTPAMSADFGFQTPNPVPANLAGGVGGSPLAQQLGSLASAPGDAMLVNPNNAPSITAGAPSMTSMLGDFGWTGGAAGAMNPSQGGANLMNPYFRPSRIG